MAELPPDLTRLGDSLEHAVGRAIARRRAQLRAAWALGAAVIAAVPMAFGAASLHLSSGDGGVPTAAPSVGESVVVSPRVLQGDRIRRDIASGRRARTGADAPPHPLDTMPPPVNARATSTYKRGVATERVDSRPPFLASYI